MRIEPYPEDAKFIPLVDAHATTPDKDARWLIWKALQRSGNVLEIGTHEGQMAREFAVLHPQRHVWTVDWPDNSSIQPWQRKEVLPASQIGNLCRYYPNVNLLFVNSQELEYDWLPGLSFVYIDGDHSYEGVKADSERAINYFLNNNKARKPGVIVWHDYADGGVTEGVKRYLDFRTDLDLVQVAERTLVYLDLE